MLKVHIAGLRTLFLSLAGLLLASGAAWAQGGGPGHTGGIPSSSGGFSGTGNGGISPNYPSYGLGFGRGYGTGMTYGGFGLGYGLGYPYYGYGFSFGGGYPNYGSAYSGSSSPSYNNRYGSGFSSPSSGGLSGSGAYPYASSGVNRSGTQPLNTYYYGATAQLQTPPKDDKAHLLLIVPENAELWFNDTKSKQSGLQREFVSPPLTPGKRYSYDIKAQWTENGKTVEQKRTARVQANTWQTIDFTKPESSADKKK